LSDPDQAVRGPPHNPGSGGWPTIRYFNQETGVNGGSYVQKTSQSICDELGTAEAMTEYIEEYGNVVTCFIDNGVGCDGKELEYVEKVKSKSFEEISKALKRLQGMSGKKMKPELSNWVKKRTKILKQFLEIKSNSDEL